MTNLSMGACRPWPGWHGDWPPPGAKLTMLIFTVCAGDAREGVLNRSGSVRSPGARPQLAQPQSPHQAGAAGPSVFRKPDLSRRGCYARAAEPWTLGARLWA